MKTQKTQQRKSHIPMSNNGWTPERRARQSQAIHRWQPWAHSTGAKTPEGKATSARNAYKGGFTAQLRAFKAQTNQMLKAQKNMVGRL